ncbi:Hypothetical protein A7982_04233 [Minicystis rosea]|nr:Hypothetical protein A7982_04233 [Minicystis rosea]
MGRARVAVTLATALFFHAAAARSQTPQPPSGARLPARVRFEPPACAAGPFDVTAFVALLQIELREDGVAWDPSGDATKEDASQAWLAIEVTPCDAGAREAVLTIGATSTRKTVRRTVFLGDAPAPLRSRLLALAAAELVRSSWREIAPAVVASTPITPPAPSTTVPISTPRAPALDPSITMGPQAAPQTAPLTLCAPPPASPPALPSPPARLHLSAAADVRALVGHLHAEGGRIGASIALSSRVPLRLTLDGGALFGTSFDRLGSVSVRIVSGALGLAGQVSIARAVLEIGPEVELGGVWAEGHAFDPAVRESHGSAFIVASSLAVTARARLGDRFWLSAALRGGALLRGVMLLAEDREAGGVAGAMLGSRVGIGFDP